MDEQRLFTLEEASALLPRLRQVLGELRKAREEMAEAQRKLEERYQGGSRGNGHIKPGSEVEGLMGTSEEARGRITNAIRAIEELGCELKDADQGMVDFRTMREGRVVYLCWLMHEPTIMFWHELDGGFRGRQAL